MAKTNTLRWKLFRSIGVLKNYVGYAQSYLGIINLMLLLATAKQAYSINISVWVILPLGGLLIVVLGAFDYFFIIEHQMEHNNQMNDMKHQLNRIESQLKNSK